MIEKAQKFCDKLAKCPTCETLKLAIVKCVITTDKVDKLGKITAMYRVFFSKSNGSGRPDTLL